MIFSGNIRSGLVFDDMTKQESLQQKSNRNSFGAKKIETTPVEKTTKAKIRLIFFLYFNAARSAVNSLGAMSSTNFGVEHQCNAKKRNLIGQKKSRDLGQPIRVFYLSIA